MDFQIEKHTLKFTFDAGTSRGIMKTRDIWLVYLHHEGCVGVGEAAPIPGLSLESTDQLEKALEEVQQSIRELSKPVHPSELFNLLELWRVYEVPSLAMALEMALLNLRHRKQSIWFPGTFASRSSSIPINGLIWMDDPASMYQQGLEKWRQGYNCIKMKIGALDFEEELSVLHQLRKLADKQSLLLRVDANGAFPVSDAAYRLKSLQKYAIHSIEQPVAVTESEALSALSEECLIPIALDESLIGVNDRPALLRNIKPQYIVLKPSLLGGFFATDAWIQTASSYGVGWWLTSALESFYGLQALAQYVSTKPIGNMHQGLGTGSLYEHNPGPKVLAEGGYLRNASI
jgi:o-succinylbenzoate synthase